MLGVIIWESVLVFYFIADKLYSKREQCRRVNKIVIQTQNKNLKDKILTKHMHLHWKRQRWWNQVILTSKRFLLHMFAWQKCIAFLWKNIVDNRLLRAHPLRDTIPSDYQDTIGTRIKKLAFQLFFTKIYNLIITLYNHWYSLTHLDHLITMIAI